MENPNIYRNYSDMIKHFIPEYSDRYKRASEIENIQTHINKSQFNWLVKVGKPVYNFSLYTLSSKRNSLISQFNPFGEANSSPEKRERFEEMLLSEQYSKEDFFNLLKEDKDGFEDMYKMFDIFFDLDLIIDDLRKIKQLDNQGL